MTERLERRRNTCKSKVGKIDDISVIARVAPEDKVRLVKVLKEKNNIVAMTGAGGPA